METKTKAIMCRALTDGETGRTRVVASTPSEDRYGDIVSPPWSLERFLGNPVVPWGHDYNIPPVGKVVALEMDGTDLVAEIEWDDSDANPLGKTVAHQFRTGFLNAVSVGFAPGESVARASLPDGDPRKAERGMVYTGSELLEISAVSIPANPEALAIRAMPTEGKEEALLSILRDDPEMRAAAEGLLLAAPAPINDPLDWLSDGQDENPLAWLL
jgi:HK97 family phage prohead protease